MAGQRLQGVGKGSQVPQGHVRLGVELVLALRDGAPGLVELIETVGRGVETALHAAEGVQQRIEAAGELVVVVLQLVFALGELGDLVQLAESGGHHQKRHAVKGEIVAAHPDGEVLLLARQGQKQYRAQIADQLHLGARRLQGQNVVLVEQGHGLQGVVIAGVLAGAGVGDGVHGDLHYAGLAGQVLRLGGHAIQGIVDRKRPGQCLKGRCGLALKVEVRGGVISEAESNGAVLADRLCSIGQVVDGVIGAVVLQRGGTVERVAFHHTALRQVAVVVQCGVIGLVIDGGHAVADGLRGQRGGGGAQQCRRGGGRQNPA